MAIERLRPRDVERLKEPGMYADGGGLYLYIGESGRAKSWLFRYSIKTVGADGEVKYRDRNMGLGPVYDISIEQARDMARACRALKRDGIDPLEHRRSEKAARQLAAGEVKTLSEIAPLFFNRFEAIWTPTYYQRARRHFDVYVLPKIGDLPIGSIDLNVVRNFLQPIQEKREVREGPALSRRGVPNRGGGPVTAEAIRIVLKQALDYAEALKCRSGANPASSAGALGMLLPRFREVHKTENQAALPINQIGAFMAELRNYSSTAPRFFQFPGRRPLSALIVEFIALCPVRKHQVTGMKWNEIDWDRRIWTCPKERTKTGKKQSGKDHELPLSNACIAVLEAMKARGNQGEYVFGGGKAASNSAVVDMLLRLPTKWVDKDGRPITIHGFRTTFQSWAIERCGLDKAKELSELVLGHAVNNGDMTRIYGRLADHSNPMRLMLEQWAQFCNQTEPLPNVIQFTASK